MRPLSGKVGVETPVSLPCYSTGGGNGSSGSGGDGTSSYCKMTTVVMLLLCVFISAAVKRSRAVDYRVSATADSSRLMEPTSVVAHSATDGEYLAQSAETGRPVVQSEIPDDRRVADEVGQKPETSPARSCGPTEVDAESRDLNNEEESEVKEPLEMPGTPESLPSLVSEPEDTCMPVKFLKVSCSYLHLWNVTVSARMQLPNIIRSTDGTRLVNSNKFCLPQ